MSTANPIRETEPAGPMTVGRGMPTLPCMSASPVCGTSHGDIAKCEQGV
jgi:hypothetical protein